MKYIELTAKELNFAREMGVSPEEMAHYVGQDSPERILYNATPNTTEAIPPVRAPKPAKRTSLTLAEQKIARCLGIEPDAYLKAINEGASK